MWLTMTLALAATSDKVDFQAEVLPVLESRCFDCHGNSKKPKAGLRLDSADWIRAGSKRGDVVVAGDAAGSSLLQRIALPEDDLDIMPPDSARLSEAEIDLVRRWINEGADFGTWTGAGGAKTAPTQPRPQHTPERVKLWRELAKGVKPIPRFAPELTALGSVEPVLPESPLLRVAFLARQAEVTDGALSYLGAIDANIVHLDLARTKITDAGMKKLAGMKRLTHIDLHSTAISDKGLRSLAKLTELRVVNLYDTNVGDATLELLTDLPHLETLYVWKTSVTRQGVEALQRAKPSLRVQWQRDLPKPRPQPIDD